MGDAHHAGVGGRGHEEAGLLPHALTTALAADAVTVPPVLDSTSAQAGACCDGGVTDTSTGIGFVGIEERVDVGGPAIRSPRLARLRRRAGLEDNPEGSLDGYGIGLYAEGSGERDIGIKSHVLL